MPALPLRVLRFFADEEQCVYLPDRRARLEYEVALGLTPAEYEARMDAGWRKFGRLLFHPVCPSCRACRPIRIPADAFTPDRSQRRAMKRNENLRIAYARPSVDDTRLDLYRRYHDAQTERKGWPEQEKEASDYAASFCDSPIPSVEITLWEEDVLRAVVLTEVTPNVVSGVYHYHDPDLRDRSLGTFAVMQTIFLAQKLGRPWAYFGYYVAGCGSLSYKARFRPCQILGEGGAWLPVTEGVGEAE